MSNRRVKKYCNQNIPDESTLRKKNVQTVYETVMREIKVSLGDEHFYIIVDECTDSCGRYIVHLMIGGLQENEPGKPYFISSKQLDKTNNVTHNSIYSAVSINFFFSPNSVPVEKFLVFLSDAAPYMVKVGQNLKIFYPNMVHVTCLLHGINRVAEELEQHIPW